MDYIAHFCKNSLLPPIKKGSKTTAKINHPDFCENGFVDIAPSKSTTGEQCWKYCPKCEAKGFPVIKRPEKKELTEKQKHSLEKLKLYRSKTLNPV
jgi:hypothetical protein